MTDLASVDYFSDPDVAQDPYEYLAYLRARNPVFREPHHDVVAVTGYQEANEIFRDAEHFSAAISIGGPFPPLPFRPAGDDITAQIEEHRHLFPINEHMVTMDPPDHTRTRALLAKLLTPKRLKENEEYMWRQADRQLDEFLAAGRCEFLDEYAKPYATLVIADLLGVPDGDRDEFRSALSGHEEPGSRVGALDHEPVGLNPLEWLEGRFGAYITDRQRQPREDILSVLATATYPDGAKPTVAELVRPATFLFAAGQETVTKLLSAAVKVLGEQPEYQRVLREDRGLVGQFVEESLRFESPTKVDFRLAKRSTQVGGVDIPAGTVVMLCIGAANRDPRKFENPDEFRLDRRNSREHIAFGRGIHTCAGAPLARAEGQVTLNRLLDRVRDIAIDDGAHGAGPDRGYRYEPTFLLRGLRDLHITFAPLGA
ncbi:cytochrome P450 [Nocardia aurantia]|uniref:Biotin biosynthesis cytochrome P450 n=1 Tax=Nocardia aurantia TaxID=2585199 RepID=A0A7K0DHL7_9NOCA|nr:cytochrome P450 [Nocardia aurantia]MQY25303.1 Biotin biosynthesis cytochrome P450 [Nocardia aurantia]